MKLLKYIIVLIAFCSLSNIYAQDNKFIKNCQILLPTDYISDGREYSILTSNTKKGILDIPFIGGHAYRIIICTEIEKYMIIKLYDKDRVLLFTSNQFKKSAYYNFEFPSTVKCILEVEIITTKKIEEYVNLLVGYKQL